MATTKKQPEQAKDENIPIGMRMASLIGGYYVTLQIYVKEHGMSQELADRLTERYQEHLLARLSAGDRPAERPEPAATLTLVGNAVE